MKLDRELLKGTTELMVLSVLAQTPAHGYDLVRRLRARSDGVFDLGEGTLYPLLYKLEEKAFIQGIWEPGAGERRRRVYRITRQGRKRLADRVEQWSYLSRGMASILGAPAYDPS